jgi:hypothetical protein
LSSIAGECSSCAPSGGEDDAVDEGPTLSKTERRSDQPALPPWVFVERMARRILRADFTKAMDSGCRFPVGVLATEHVRV